MVLVVEAEGHGDARGRAAPYTLDSRAVRLDHVVLFDDFGPEDLLGFFRDVL